MNEDRPRRPAPAGRGENRPHDRRPPRPRTDGAAREKRPMNRSFQRPNQGEGSVSPSRLAAFRAISDVTEHDAYVAMAVNRQLSDTTMSAADRALCTAITYGTLENLLAIDHILSAYLPDMAQVEPRVLTILRMAVCQKNWMDRIPDNAIADESVRLTRCLRLESLTGLVNGVVRAFLRSEKPVEWPEDPFERLALEHSMPLWLAEKLREAYGLELAEQILSYRPTERGIVLRPNMTQLSDEAFEALLQKKVWSVRKGRVPHAWIAEGVMQLGRDRDYLSGLFSAQGEASMACCRLADARPGMTVLDCCAAPGGKTAYMAEAMQGTGRVFALDLHPHRVALLEAAVKRLRLDNVRPQQTDATRYKEDWEERFDLCLLDAPCSGLGEWHQKPDIVLGISPDSVAKLTETQRLLMDNCAKYVKKNGRLVYATCSILPEENEAQVRAFLARHPEYRAEPIPDDLLALYPGARHELGLQLLPGPDGAEGFYMAALKRQG